MKNTKLLVMGLVVSGIVLTGCQSNEAADNESENENSYVIGLDDTFAPMGFRNDDGDLVGFDIDLANAIADDLDYTISFQPIDWALKETELNAGNIDMIWNGYTITEERSEKVDFSTPYLENSQMIVTLAGNDIDTKQDLEGKKVAAQQSSSAVSAIEKDPSNILEEFEKGEVIQFPSNNDVFNDLISGRSEAIVVDETLGRFYMAQNESSEYKVLEDDFGKEEYAIGFRQDDDELREAFSDSLEKIMEENTYDDIYQKWFNN
ncbi:MAG: amino acid ABC transporter substrate-binding protein [Alkalibacterium sp.]|uniref:amino acid ABC transporter substrate-binding protein n=1 Tax=Alkalibacterium TaxID=99906 RepID=UPI002648EA56|nr:amino acid ABC transporter substrate-binding protein [Alkalibacterium sp.]MDN6194041.1 amino acid ABC transporter substrate-binding protein [Alkalibacterium sp.]MDN6293216.1 amino acid ABC transporter substrate-binding protein [Alkalibacterium sp.]MDN6295262.1 amino acid ABC transporter substrate-binding protein [Alkalibacterium sp.]MDN6326989.1 amino acid ABC transporter substrate-binding protein [Alkalibacterium sp.]MDN6398120.1 amino acid ABC transporter substrate-binding protein [Alkali